MFDFENSKDFMPRLAPWPIWVPGKPGEPLHDILKAIWIAERMKPSI